MKHKKPTLVVDHNAIPQEIELFGRKIKTLDDSSKLSLVRSYGEARYGVNEIALNNFINGLPVTEDEKKITWLHEVLHFILNFTGYEEIIQKGEKIDLEQFIELLASGIYQYEKTAKY
jgi:hypothetical protein